MISDSLSDLTIALRLDIRLHNCIIMPERLLAPEMEVTFGIVVDN